MFWFSGSLCQSRDVLSCVICNVMFNTVLFSFYFNVCHYFRIAEFKDPKDRMVQVVRWYMSAYHAGRKSSVAKKPYNPVIGEVFQCYWDIPGSNNSAPLVTDGPVPWCSRNQLTFISEQVSHHPPSKCTTFNNSNVNCFI